jgi:hypothetical protein
MKRYEKEAGRQRQGVGLEDVSSLRIMEDWKLPPEIMRIYTVDSHGPSQVKGG